VESTTQRLTFIAVAILSILVLTIAGATLPPAYAVCTFSSSLSSSNITQGTSGVTVSGTDTCDPTGTIVEILLCPGTCPPADGNVGSTFATTGAGGAFSASISTSSLSLGSYCVYVASTVSFPSTPANSDPLTVTSVAPPIPEYPVGLAVLALLMVLSYAVIRRRTRT
jgi:hypothetical protein